MERRREKRKGKRIAKASRCWKIWSIDNVYTHIYTHTGSVCYRKLEEKTARGPTLCTFTGVGGVSHSVVGVSHLAAGSSFASISSHPNADDFAGSLSGSFVVVSPLSSSLASISGGRERAPRLFFRFQKPRRSPRPIRSSNSNSTTNYCLSLDRIHVYTLVSLLSLGRGRSRGWTWNPWREWNPREYPSGHACRRAGAVLPSIVDEPADRSRRVD